MRFNINQSAASCVCVAIFSGLCIGQVVDQDYKVEHNFNFQPSGDVIEVIGSEFRHAWIQTDGIFGNVWSVESLTQSPDFDPFGTESFAGGFGGIPSAFNSGLAGLPVQCSYNLFNIPPAGINGFQCIILPLDASFADACTEFFVAPYSTMPPFSIQGTVGSSGGVHAINASCYAYSSAAVSVRGGINLANGSIQWSPVISDAVGGGTGAISGMQDPVYMVAFNLDTGTQVEASFFDYTLDSSGPGMVLWENGVFETDHTDLEFILDIPPTYLAPGESGNMHLLIENGVITISDDSGIFNGMLPPAGDSVPLVFPLPSDFLLNYNLNLDPAFGWDVTMDLSGAGNSLAMAGCRADLNGDGDLNFFDISLFIELFTEGDLGADFTDDKELNFFDVSAFISAYSKGCDSK
jgi:hypothetical protein